uniref:Uncharacterized protein n=1 Tax=Cacopsylla melanoneura TaxID=428564 RepID=A0A8D8ZAP7_9HEMI
MTCLVRILVGTKISSFFCPSLLFRMSACFLYHLWKGIDNFPLSSDFRSCVGIDEKSNPSTFPALEGIDNFLLNSDFRPCVGIHEKSKSPRSPHWNGIDTFLLSSDFRPCVGIDDQKNSSLHVPSTSLKGN